jgi:hypothetical protein
MDYDKSAKTTKEFFKKVQNKLHYAVHRHTAAEIIIEKADADQKNMGLTTWKSAPEEIDFLNRLVSMNYSDWFIIKFR